MDKSEPALVLAWQRGDEQATRTLFDLHYPRLARLAVLSGLTLDEAQDCAQETFVRAFERRKQLRDPLAFPLWFQRIATNHMLNALKFRGRKKQVPLDEAGELHEDWARTRVTQPDELAIAEEGRVQLWLRVQALPTNYRVPLVLRYYGNYSLREVADLLGKREGAIRVSIHRAMQQLRLFAEEDPVQLHTQAKPLQDQTSIGVSR